MMGVKIEALLAVASGRKYPAFGENEHLFIQNGGHLQRHSIHLCSIGLYFSNHIVDVRLCSLKLAHWFSSVSSLGRCLGGVFRESR